MGRYKDIIDLSKEAEKLALETNNQEILSNTYRLRAISYTELGFNDESLKYLKKALNATEEIESKNYKLYIYNGFASYSAQINAPINSVIYYQKKSLITAEKLDNNKDYISKKYFTMALAYLNLSKTSVALNRMKDAENYLSKALKICHNGVYKVNKYLEVSTYNEFAWLYYNQKEYDKSINISCTDIPGCQWTVHVYDFLGFGDEVSWSLKDSAGGTVLSGGGYGDTQTALAEGPLTFYIESMGTFGDNTPVYTVSNGTTDVVSGSLPGELGVQEATYSAINCASLAILESNLSSFKYYPNPVKDILNISADQNIKSLTIYSLEGKLIMDKISINKKSKEVNLSALKKGNYVAVVNLSDGSTKSFKIIK